jgi:mono/diheme cytochrome c family protein
VRRAEGAASILTGLCVTLLALGCTREPKPQAERGAGVFQRACASCHGVGRQQKVALGFKVAPPDLLAPELQRRVTDAGFKQVIREGKGQMPPFGQMLADEEVNDLLVYLRNPARSSPPAR